MNHQRTLRFPAPPRAAALAGIIQKHYMLWLPVLPNTTNSVPWELCEVQP
ncbi:MAG: hypothetical protein HKL96_09655 [Phycisphaerales bacterium]|nr:hypothetical protein [Phycisphaerales bacterium]